MNCAICDKELHKGDVAFEAHDVSMYGKYPVHSVLFCSEECASKNGHSDAQKITIQRTDNEWNKTMNLGIKTLKKLGFTFPEGVFPFWSKDKSVFGEKSSDTILIVKLPK